MLDKLYRKIDDREISYYIEYTSDLSKEEQDIIYLLCETDKRISMFEDCRFEIGPKLHIVTPWCSNALTILKRLGIDKITRIEYSIRSLVPFDYDKMTHELYNTHILSLSLPFFQIQDVQEIEAIIKFSQERKLGFDKQDVNFYFDYFSNILKRKPRDIELFDLAQSNSEHSRHWFFNGKISIDGIYEEKTLMQHVKDTQKEDTNSIIAFSDNASAIKGKDIYYLFVEDNKYVCEKKLFHPTLTAETHNYPTGISPFPGANTGVGGRIRDNQAIGRGGLTIAGSAGYCVGLLSNKRNLEILIEASNGASDYGNKFGEPIIYGFCRSFGIFLPNERVEWLKPIMFTSGTGLVYDGHIQKHKIEKGDNIVKIGGPAYRIGIGGGSGSSTENSEDFNAVQRGDPEMQQKMNRVVRACIEMFFFNPIQSIHDQGAGGNANVLKELVYPNGGTIDLNRLAIGDKSMSALELWCAEYQENNALIIKEKDIDIVKKIAERENVTCSIIGKVNNDGYIKVNFNNKNVVDLKLKEIISTYQKTFNLQSYSRKLSPLVYYIDLYTALEKILCLPSVGSKAFLTNKVDRSVTGLIAQQQCIGPYQLPLSNVAVVAHSYFEFTGTATAIGEQPIKGLIDIEKMVHLTIVEMLTNLVWAKVSSFEDIRCSANWMWPAKYEGAELVKACKELCRSLKSIGIAIDGGKDSLSMAKIVNENVVKCPGSLVLTGYVFCPDIRKTVTPDLKRDDSFLIYIPFSNKFRLGGSAFAYVNSQIGNDCPDVKDLQYVKKVFTCINNNLEKILSGHDVSDGGLCTTLIEMAIGGDIGVHIDLSPLICTFLKDIVKEDISIRDIIIHQYDMISILFSEEPGIVLEVTCASFCKDIKFFTLGRTREEKIFEIDECFSKSLFDLRKLWSKGSFEIEKVQIGEKLALSEYMMNGTPTYKVNSQLLLKTPPIPIELPYLRSGHKVIICRDEGSNGDREMAAAFYSVGFDTFDFCTNDLYKADLSSFSGIVFVGGFTFSDVFGAGKGWALSIMKRVKSQLDNFLKRKDTFCLGVCNGCQVLSQLGIVDAKFTTNCSKRFESRYLTVKIFPNNSIFLSNFENCVLPLWVAHKEGKCDVKNAPIRYVNEKNEPTETYPYNPNGSTDGAAGVISENGRCLAIMGHPERTFLSYQLAYNPYEWEVSPWHHLFVNAYKWVLCTL